MERHRFPLSLNPRDAVKKDEPSRRTMLLKIPCILSADIAARRLLTASRDNPVPRLSATGNPLTVIKDFIELPTAAGFLNHWRTPDCGSGLNSLNDPASAAPASGCIISNRRLRVEFTE